MTHFNRFALTMHCIFGERMKRYEEFCKQVWSSLVNVDWTHVDGDKGDYSFRSAGGLISDEKKVVTWIGIVLVPMVWYQKKSQPHLPPKGGHIRC